MTICGELFEAPPLDGEDWWRAIDALGAEHFLDEGTPPDDVVDANAAIDLDQQVNLPQHELFGMDGADELAR